MKNRRQGMPVPNIIIGQRVDEAKVQCAIQMRRTMTPAERVLWRNLRANRLGGFHFRRQQVIDGFIADFYCHAAALIVEVDGPIHESQIEYDAKRDHILTERGFLVLRFRNEEIATRLSEILVKIGDERRARVQKPLPRPLPQNGEARKARTTG